MALRDLHRYAIVFGIVGHCAIFGPAQSQTPAAQPNQVVVSGTVPDEATRSAILAQARSVYGPERVVDQLGVGPVVAPPNWSEHVQKVLSPEIKHISRGQLAITGNDIDLKGEVVDEARRAQIAADMAGALNATYVVRNGLRVAALEQGQVDAALAGRTIEFEQSSSALRPSGRAVLDDMAHTLLKLGRKKLEVIGHTDSLGSRDANMALSLARADAVRAHLVAKGINAALITTSGAGPDRPVATNDTADGRARNRRIEFRISG